jgi:hypothetical protein
MKAILLVALLTAATAAGADPMGTTRHVQAANTASVELQSAEARVAETRRQWDAAVAGGHPVAAGTWAVRHYEAMQARRVAYERSHTAAARVAVARSSR